MIQRLESKLKHCLSAQERLSSQLDESVKQNIPSQPSQEAKALEMKDLKLSDKAEQIYSQLVPNKEHGYNEFIKNQILEISSLQMNQQVPEKDEA